MSLRPDGGAFVWRVPAATRVESAALRATRRLLRDALRERIHAAVALLLSLQSARAIRRAVDAARSLRAAARSGNAAGATIPPIAPSLPLLHAPSAAELEQLFPQQVVQREQARLVGQ